MCFLFGRDKQFLKKKLRQIVFNVNRVYFSEQEIV